MWYKEINNNSELNIKKKDGNCTDYLLIFYWYFIDFSCCLYWKIGKFCNFTSEFISQLRKGNRRTQAIDALRLLLLSYVCDSSPYTYWLPHVLNDNLKIPSGPFEGPENSLIFAIVILNAIPEIIESQYGNTNHKGPDKHLDMLLLFVMRKVVQWS